MTLKELLACSESNEDNKQWYYFDYKHMQEWFKDNQDIIESLNWEKFGFNKNGSDSTLWIGTKGAHTNCHQDSYGCNLVAQIHGKKEWLLFPPSSGSLLKPTRVPYEESTIYSSFNFFSPSEETDSLVQRMQPKPRLIVLEQGDVLLVPKGWWHYVESLDLSTSVNVWLPIAQDNEARVKEAITKLIVAKIGRKVCPTSKDARCSFSYCINLLDAALKEYKQQNGKDTLNTKKIKTHSWTASELSEEYPTYVKLIPELDDSELRNILRNKRHRFNVTITDLIQEDLPVESKKDNSLSHKELIESVVNALCHPDVVDKVTDILVNP